MATLEDILTKQSQQMAAVQRILPNFKKMGQAKMTLAVTRQRLAFLKEQFSKCQDLDQEIVLRADGKARSLLPYFTEGQFLRCEEMFHEAADFMVEIIARAESGSSSRNFAGASESQGKGSSHLPKLRLPLFDGSFNQWETFRDKFTSLIVNDSSLTDVERMQYLSSCVSGDASNALDHLAITAANFAIAWKILVRRYENKRRLISFHMHTIHNLPTVRSETFQEIRDLRDKVNSSIHALSNLGRAGKEWEDSLVYLVSQRLDPATRKAWELQLGDSREFPSFNQLNAFLDARVQALESIPDSIPAKNKNATQLQSKSDRPKNVSSHALATESLPNRAARVAIPTSACPVCRANHLIYQCEQFQNQTPVQRYTLIRNFKRCVNCFSSKHNAKDCTSTRSCKQCHKRHHTLLHFADSSSANSNSASNPTKIDNNVTDALTATLVSSVNDSGAVPNTITNHLAPGDDTPFHSVLLATARIRLYAPNGHSVHARALIDQGSVVTILTENMAQVLRLPKSRQTINVSGVGDSKVPVHHAVNIVFSPSSDSGPKFSTTALVMKSITKYLPTRVTISRQWSHLEGLELADGDPMSSDPIDLLIGADLYGSLLLEGVRKGSADQPIAQKTALGWILSGPTSSSTPSVSVSSHHAITISSLDADIRRFWELEEIPYKVHVSIEEKHCEEHFVATHSRDATGRYIVRLPFKADPAVDLGDSRSVALQRFIQLEKRLDRDLKLLQSYRDFMTEYLQLNHMEPVCPESLAGGPRYFIPHHAVCKPDSETTPLRVVFNASSRTSTGKSLNDCLMIGPKLQNDLSSILLRWRHFRYVFTADSAKMYRQILLDPRDRNYQTILWRTSPSEPVSEFRLRTVTYGTAPAAFLAQRVLKQLGEDEGHDFPLALPVLQHQMYVDDLIFGSDDRQLALCTRDQLVSLLNRGGFRLRKWASNCQTLLQGIDPSDHGLAYEKPIKSDEYMKVLGVSWNPESDMLKFRVTLPSDPGISKRAILSIIARLFDPLGLVAPVVITAKILMQKLWSVKCGWDDPVPAPLLKEWSHFHSTLSDLNAIAIPRWTRHSSDIVQYSLHGFSDASSHAYAAVIYSRLVSVDGSVSVSILMAKSKVAPLKTISIPRLELQAALLLTKLMAHLRDTLSSHKIEYQFWTDSTVTLSWLRQPPSQWQTFVANRVSEIQTSFPEATWRHVPSQDNPADCASRGLHAPEILSRQLWWEGPSWLRLSPGHWPAQAPEPSTCVPERRHDPPICSMTLAVSCPWVSRFSSWPKLLRVVAFVFRFVAKLRKQESLQSNTKEPAGYMHSVTRLQPQEIQTAKNYLLRSAQFDSFPVEFDHLASGRRVAPSSSLISLNPFLDSNNLIRVGGRLEKSGLSDRTRHPIVLRSHPLLTLIISHHHLRTLHAGPSLTLASLRDEFWILRARTTVRSVLHRCVPCARERAVTPTELMGSLPAVRVNRTSRAFVHTGVDYAGPILVRDSSGRGHKAHKAYLALFVCMTTKAIHLELVHDYGSAAFLGAFHRFVARRGYPQSMYSDNGTTFQGADRELTIAYRAATRDPNFLNFVATESVQWHFLPPSAPHFGGLWEAGVRRAKHHLKRCMGNYTLTVEELTTLLCRVEACLNSRPIAAVSEHVEDYSALTPGHFLIGAPLLSIPEPSVISLHENRLSRWQLVQRISENFWTAWSREYLHTLQQRPKWRTTQRLARVGRLVLLRNPLAPPCKWELARITACHPGDDGLVRVVTVKTCRSTYTRPINKICFLPVDINEESQREECMAGGAPQSKRTSDHGPSRLFLAPSTATLRSVDKRFEGTPSRRAGCSE